MRLIDADALAYELSARADIKIESLVDDVISIITNNLEKRG